MKRCKIKLGYFVLKECGAIAVAQCNRCQGYFCIKHLHGELEAIKGLEPDRETGIIKAKKEEREILCVQCFARSQKQTLQTSSDYTYYDDWFWYFIMRDSFYRSSHYKPFSETESKSMKEKNEEFVDETQENSFLDS
ncbi:MAG: hypothetical protein RMJ97_10730 [Raineya sp.]|nr:hypothetical protein [Raineya sp.]MDW8297342.1 hypothetical protein [Raineya sp.]